VETILPSSSKNHFLDKTILFVFTSAMFLVIWFRKEPISYLVIASILIAMMIHLYPDVHRTLGTNMRKKPIIQDWLSATWMTLALATVLAFISWLSGAWQAKSLFVFTDKPSSELLLEKLPTVAFQQVLLQWFLVPVLTRIFTRRWMIAIWAASIFSLLHMPNPILMGLTFIAGVSWVIYYQSRKRFVPIIASHFALAILASGFCGEYIFHMRVGPSCVKIFPRELTQYSVQGFELPGCVDGSVDSVIDAGSYMQIEGWIADANHDIPPQSLFLESTERLVPLIDVKFEQLLSDEPSNDLSSQENNRYSFRAIIDKSDIPKSGRAELWVKNVNGWYCALGERENFALHVPEAPSIIPIPTYTESPQAVRQASAIEGLDIPIIQ
jgi:Type II CAAX prenyl endopeptidase Rce1-like